MVDRAADFRLMPMRAVAVPEVPTAVEPLAGVASSQSPPETVLCLDAETHSRGTVDLHGLGGRSGRPQLVIERRRCGARRQLPEVQSHGDFLLYACDGDNYFAYVGSGCQTRWVGGDGESRRQVIAAGGADRKPRGARAEARNATCVPAGALVDGTSVPDTRGSASGLGRQGQRRRSELKRILRECRKGPGQQHQNNCDRR